MSTLSWPWGSTIPLLPTQRLTDTQEYLVTVWFWLFFLLSTTSNQFTSFYFEIQSCQLVTFLVSKCTVSYIMLFYSTWVDWLNHQPCDYWRACSNRSYRTPASSTISLHDGLLAILLLWKFLISSYYFLKKNLVHGWDGLQNLQEAECCLWHDQRRCKAEPLTSSFPRVHLKDETLH